MKTITPSQLKRLIKLHEKHVTVMEHLYHIIDVQNKMLHNINRQAELFVKDHAAIKKDMLALKKEIHQKLPPTKKACIQKNKL